MRLVIGRVDADLELHGLLLPMPDLVGMDVKPLNDLDHQGFSIRENA